VPVRLVADLDRNCLARIEAQRLRLPGISIRVEPKREYKYNGMGAHLIGYLSQITEEQLSSDAYADYLSGESIGKVGVERAYEEFLHGSRGGRQVEVDAAGRRVRLLSERSPEAGRNLWLTLDISLQKEVEACLEGKHGAIVALDPRDGAVLAMASSPSFDQEMFIRGISRDEWRGISRDPAHPLLNRASASAYPPGSTYKPFVALAALQEGVTDLENTVWCPGYLSFAGRRYRCWRDYGHGHMEVHQAIVQSCDVYFYQMGLKLGVDRIAKYAKAFGFGTVSGLGLDSEHPGLIPTAEWKKRATGVPWQKGESLSVAIGQGFNLTTPLQMAVAYAALANGGTVWKPYVVDRVEGGGKNVRLARGAEEAGTVPVEPRYLQKVQEALRGVVEERRGTAHRISHEDVVMAGKTGTAQVVRMSDNISRKQWEESAKREEMDHAWFVGYAPADRAEIVVAVLVEHGGHGSSAAAPLARRVMLHHLGIAEEES
jgi:penicillin-binding protein 2